MFLKDRYHTLRLHLAPTLRTALACATVALAVAAPAGAAATAPLGAMSDAVSGMPGYRASISLYERKGAQVQQAVYDYSFSRPDHATLHVVAGASAGGTLDWNGGSTVVAHKGGGIVGLFKKTLPLHDPLTTTIRGSSVDELSFGAIIAHVRSTPGTLRQGNGGTVNGAATTAFTLIPASPVRDGGYTREIVDISNATHLPVRVLGFAGRTMLRQVDFTNITANK